MSLLNELEYFLIGWWEQAPGLHGDDHAVYEGRARPWHEEMSLLRIANETQLDAVVPFKVL